MLKTPVCGFDVVTVQTILLKVVDEDKTFILNFKKGEPNWSYFSVDHVSKLPATKWKQYNLNKMSIKERDKIIDSLVKYFNVFSM